jgi:pimeloyl-ACP methyl ester carboxylesterase
VRRLFRSTEGEAEVRRWCRDRLSAWSVPHEATVLPTVLGETHVLVAGTGDRVCVFLPGTNFNTATSTTVLGRLADRSRVYAVDLPGQPGLSAADRPADEPTDYGKWAGELLRWVHERHAGARIVLAGHSRGAAVALSAPPDLVDGLALLSPAGLLGVRPSRAMLRATLPWLLRPGPAGSRRLVEYMSAPGAAVDPTLVEWLTLVARTTRTTGAPGPLARATTARWHRRNVQVMVGEHDCFFAPERLAQQTRSQLGQEPHVVAGAGHLLVEERPDAVAELVTQLF